MNWEERRKGKKNFQALFSNKKRWNFWLVGTKEKQSYRKAIGGGWRLWAVLPNRERDGASGWSIRQWPRLRHCKRFGNTASQPSESPQPRPASREGPSRQTNRSNSTSTSTLLYYLERQPSGIEIFRGFYRLNWSITKSTVIPTHSAWLLQNEEKNLPFLAMMQEAKNSPPTVKWIISNYLVFAWAAMEISAELINAQESAATVVSKGLKSFPINRTRHTYKWWVYNPILRIVQHTCNKKKGQRLKCINTGEKWYWRVFRNRKPVSTAGKLQRAQFSVKISTYH